MIQMYHVNKSYNGVPALIDINLKVEKGNFIFLTGPSGAGKTTLLKLIFCEENATDGQILVDGRNIARLKASSIPYLRRNIGFVFQDFRLIRDRSIFENIALPLQIRGLSGKEIKTRVFNVLRMVGLQNKREFLPERLSGGEQQRAAIIRAVINEPQLLLADEPTGNLDDKITISIMNLFEEINSKGTTIIFATHDRWLLNNFPRRTVVLDHGRTVHDG